MTGPTEPLSSSDPSGAQNTGDLRRREDGHAQVPGAGSWGERPFVLDLAPLGPPLPGPPTSGPPRPPKPPKPAKPLRPSSFALSSSPLDLASGPPPAGPPESTESPTKGRPPPGPPSPPKPPKPSRPSSFALSASRQE